MKKYIYFTIIILMVAFVAQSYAQDRPNAKQNKTIKPKVSSSDKGGSQIKYNKLVKTKDPGDEYSGVRIDNFAQKKPKKKKVNNDTVDVADDVEGKSPTNEDYYYFDENPQDREDRENAFYDAPSVPLPSMPNLQERPGQPEEMDDDDNSDLVRGLPDFLLSQKDDPGAESEDEILYAGDSASVHSEKMDVSLMEPVTLSLVDPDHGKHFVFPTPQRAIATSHFGPRRRRFHYGLDLAMPTGEPIYAAFDGVVRFSKYNSSYGHLVVIRHDNGLETYYAHLSKRHVAPGMHVKAGDIIGLCGNTGRSRGSHLHFEIRYKGNAMNPENVISTDTRDLISPTLTLTHNSFRKVAKRGKENTGSQSSRRSSSGNYSSDGKYYKVRTGDTLGRIAKRNGTTVSKLCKLNGLRENSVIRPGQKLRIR
jgi:murein DD-endopeptidase MepM/ murein hydrolase activator NlpD